MDSQTSPQKKPLYKRWWFWVAVVIVLLVILSLAGSSGNQGGDTAQQSTTTSQANTVSVDATQAYANAVTATVIPFVQSGTNDLELAAQDGSNQDWTDALHNAQGAEDAFARAKGAYDTLPQPPTSLTEANQLIGKALASYTQSAQLIVAGIHAEDASKINEGAAYLTEGTDYINQASDSLK